MNLIKPPLKLKAESEALSIVSELVGVTAVVIATADGFEISSATRYNFDPARIAAMASSISAIGKVVSAETRLGRCRSISVATDDGFAFITTARHGQSELVVNIIADSTAILAQVMYRSVKCVRILEAE